jgi:hypothetical protein
MKYYQSKFGQIKSRSDWEDQLDNFWDSIIKANPNKFKRPKDAWERMCRALELKDVTHEVEIISYYQYPESRQELIKEVGL